MQLEDFSAPQPTDVREANTCVYKVQHHAKCSSAET